MQAQLLAFTFGNFVIGSGMMVVTAMLNELATGLGVSVPQAGVLISAAGAVLFVGAPLAAAFTAHIERHKLLIGSLLVSGVGHLLCALAPTYAWLLPLRMLAVLGAAVFTPQAAVTIGLLAPPEQRSRAIVLIFLGWSAASVLGMPLGSLVGGLLGWRAGFGMLGILTLLAAWVVARVTPKGLRVSPMPPAIWRGMFANRLISSVFVITLITLSAQFIFHSYLAPLLRESLDVTPTTLSLYFLWAGACAVTGNMLISRYIGRLGSGKTSLLALGVMAMAMLIWLPAHGSHWLTAVVLGLWGAGTFAAGSAQQVRSVSIDPRVASAGIAVNTAMLYGGQALGSSVGGGLIAHWGLQVLSLVSFGVLMLAMALSTWLMRRGH